MEEEGTMFKNNFKIALRNLLKDRQFTFLNLIGLSTGLACTFLIYLWVNDELHVDKYNEKDQQLFQVMVNQHNDNGIKTGSFTPGLLANALEKEIPEIEYAVTVLPASWFPNKGVISSGDAHIKAGASLLARIISTFSVAGLLMEIKSGCLRISTALQFPMNSP